MLFTLKNMNRRVKKLWVAALRSGKYKQAKGALRRKQNSRWGYCCLGVLSHLAEKEGVGKFKGPSFNDADPSGSWGSAFLTPGVMKWAQLSRDNPTAKKRQLSYCNDHGSSFEEIADMIEKEKPRKKKA